MMQVKPKVEEMLLQEVELQRAMDDSLGKEDLDKALDTAFEAQGGEEGDVSAAFPLPEFEETEVKDAEVA